MLPALEIDDIEAEVKKKLAHKPVDAVVLVFAAYPNRPRGVVADYLRRWDDYHYHSGAYIDLFHVGYSRWDGPQPQWGSVDVSEVFGGKVGHFYPELFHKIRRFIKMRTKDDWDYVDGVDFLIFRVTDNPDMIVDFSKAIAIRSSDLVPALFASINDLAREFFNFAEYKRGRMEPDDFSRKLALIRARKNIGFLAHTFGPKIFELAAKPFVGS